MIAVKPPLIILMVFLVQSIATTPAYGRQAHGIEIPELSPWPAGVEDIAPNIDGTITLGEPATIAIDKRLLECEMLPQEFEQAVDDYQLLLEQEIAVKLSRDRKNIYERALQQAKRLQSYDAGWEAWQVGLLVAAGISGGLLVGFLAGYAYGDINQ